MGNTFQKTLILILVASFTSAILRVSGSSILNAEEEIIENLVKNSHKKNVGLSGFDFLELYNDIDSKKNNSLRIPKQLEKYNIHLKYQPPSIDIPLMPPEMRL
jgi:hypothetical protein